jgi:MFS transporter, DHA1 family, multidrug resistance protein
MSDLFRETPLGQIVHYISKGKYLKYPEELDNFEFPAAYTAQLEKDKSEQVSARNSTDSEQNEEIHLAKTVTARSMGSDIEKTLSAGIGADFTSDALNKAITQQENLAKAVSMPISPTKLDDGTVLVDWYTTDDPANPQNWSSAKKGFVAFQICMYTFAVYMGSAIFTPSQPYIEEIFGVSPAAASLGLALYVLAYGMGPLIFSPLSEIPIIGRNIPYMITFIIFVILCVPAALVDNFAGLLVLRFLQGFFGSPALATGGASMGDLYNIMKLPYFLCFWVAAAVCGPALGPTISGFSVPKTNWHWSLWELLWVAGPVLVLMFTSLPETSASNILLHRARRLRTLTGDDRLRAQSEIDQGNMKIGALIGESIWRPIEIMVLDPAVLFANLYTSLIYAIYYSYFEVFPLVYIPLYGFNLGELGLTFLSVLVGAWIGIAGYFLYLYYVVEPEIMKNGLGKQERRLIPALYASMLIPIGLFLFGWTSNVHVHWIASVIGIAITTTGVFVVFQCIFMYLPLTYPQYAASLFAANDFSRSTLAAAAILFARPLYINLGVGPGISLLAGITVACVAGVWALYYFGETLRHKSRFALK